MKRILSFSNLLAVLPLLSHWSPVQAFTLPAAPPQWHFVPPAGSGVINVRDYGAKGDGVTDDTEAINRAISENIDKHRYRSNPFIWLPKGIFSLGCAPRALPLCQFVIQPRDHA